MDDILTSIIGIGLSVVLMFIFPLMSMTERTDDISQLTAEIATSEFVEDIRRTGRIEPKRYEQFLDNLGSTGNTYNVEIEARILDENPTRKITQTSGTQGDNVYYSVYTSQVLNDSFFNDDIAYYLKEGDIVTVSVNNTNQTMSQQLKNFFYKVVGKETYVIAASHGGLVSANGQ